MKGGASRDVGDDAFRDAEAAYLRRAVALIVCLLGAGVLVVLALARSAS